MADTQPTAPDYSDLPLPLQAIISHESDFGRRLIEEGAGHPIDRSNPDLGNEKGGGLAQMSPSTLVSLIQRYPKKLGKYSALTADWPKNADNITNQLATNHDLAKDSARVYAGELIKQGADTPEKLFYSWNHGGLAASKGFDGVDLSKDDYTQNRVMPIYQKLKAVGQTAPIPVGSKTPPLAPDAYNDLYSRYSGQNAREVLRGLEQQNVDPKTAEYRLLQEAHKVYNKDPKNESAVLDALGSTDPTHQGQPLSRVLQSSMARLAGNPAVEGQSDLGAAAESVVRGVGKAGSALSTLGQTLDKYTGREYNPILSPISSTGKYRDLAEKLARKVTGTPEPIAPPAKSFVDPFVNTVGSLASQIPAEPGAAEGIGASAANVARSAIGNMSMGTITPAPATDEQMLAHMRAYQEFHPLMQDTIEPATGMAVGGLAMEGVGKLAGAGYRMGSETRVQSPVLDQGAIAKRVAQSGAYSNAGKALDTSLNTTPEGPANLGNVSEYRKPQPSTVPMKPVFKNGIQEGFDIPKPTEITDTDVSRLFRDAGEQGVQPNVGNRAGYERVRSYQTPQDVSGPEGDAGPVESDSEPGTPKFKIPKMKDVYEPKFSKSFKLPAEAKKAPIAAEKPIVTSPATDATPETAPAVKEAVKKPVPPSTFSQAIQSLKQAKNEYHLHNALNKHAEALGQAADNPALARVLGETLDSHETDYAEPKNGHKLGGVDIAVTPEQIAKLKAEPKTYTRLQMLRDVMSKMKDRALNEKGAAGLDINATADDETPAGVKPVSYNNPQWDAEIAAREAAKKGPSALSRLVSRVNNVDVGAGESLTRSGRQSMIDQISDRDPALAYKLRKYAGNQSGAANTLERLLLSERGAVNKPGVDVPEEKSLSKFEPTDPDAKDWAQNHPQSMSDVAAREGFADTGRAFFGDAKQTREVVPGNELSRNEQLSKKFWNNSNPTSDKQWLSAIREVVPSSGGIDENARFEQAAADVSSMHMPSDPTGPAQGIIPENRFGERIDPRLAEQRLQQGLADMREGVLAYPAGDAEMQIQRAASQKEIRDASRSYNNIPESERERLSPRDVVKKDEGTLYGGLSGVAKIPRMMNEAWAKATESLGLREGDKAIPKLTAVNRMQGAMDALHTSTAELGKRLNANTFLTPAQRVAHITAHFDSGISKVISDFHREALASGMRPSEADAHALNTQAFYDKTSKLLNTANKVMGVRKVASMVTSPASMIGETLAEGFSSALSGDSPLTLPRDLVNLVKADHGMPTPDAHIYRAFKELGGGDEGYFRSSKGDPTVNKMLLSEKIASGNTLTQAVAHTQQIYQTLTNAGMNAYDFQLTSARYHAFAERMHAGMSPEKAMVEVNKYYQRYGVPSMGARGAGFENHPLTKLLVNPSFKYPVNMLRIMKNAALEKPVNLMLTLGALKAIQMKGVAMAKASGVKLTPEDETKFLFVHGGKAYDYSPLVPAMGEFAGYKADNGKGKVANAAIAARNFAGNLTDNGYLKPLLDQKQDESRIGIANSVGAAIQEPSVDSGKQVLRSLLQSQTLPYVATRVAKFGQPRTGEETGDKAEDVRNLLGVKEVGRPQNRFTAGARSNYNSKQTDADISAKIKVNRAEMAGKVGQSAAERKKAELDAQIQKRRDTE